jgi:hypothetical protein
MVWPLVSNADSGQTAKAVKTLPDSLRQLVQWHIPTRSGSPATL